MKEPGDIICCALVVKITPTVQPKKIGAKENPANAISPNVFEARKSQDAPESSVQNPHDVQIKCWDQQTEKRVG